MASWMVHLRVADILLDRIGDLSATEFIVGNIAPDSGVPNADWSSFTPSTKLSHFKRTEGGPRKDICLADFVQQYFTAQQQDGYDKEQYAFYLGYLVHLMTDILWADKIVLPAMNAHAAQCREDRNAFIWKMKEDWYDLDFLYLREHPDFRAFRIYHNAVGFENRYMDIFAPDAFDNRREYITGYYLGPSRQLDREYPYLTKEGSEQFVRGCADAVIAWLPEYCIPGKIRENP